MVVFLLPSILRGLAPSLHKWDMSEFALSGVPGKLPSLFCVDGGEMWRISHQMVVTIAPLPVTVVVPERGSRPESESSSGCEPMLNRLAEVLLELRGDQAPPPDHFPRVGEQPRRGSVWLAKLL